MVAVGQLMKKRKGKSDSGVSSSSSLKKKGVGKSEKNGVGSSSSEEKSGRYGIVPSPSHAYKKKVLERAKARGIVIGYPGKRPNHASSSYSFRVAEKVPYHQIWIDRRRKQLADFGRFSLKCAPNRKRRLEQPVTPLFKIDPDARALILKLTKGLRRQSIPDPDATGDDAFIPKYQRDKLKEIEEHMEDRLVYDIENAEVALAHFNSKQDVKYELTETIGTFSRFEFGNWYHCNFWARPTSTSAGCTDPSPKLFFAELYKVEVYFIEVKHCCIFNEKGSRSQVARGCNFCPKEMAHPTKGFKAGRRVSEIKPPKARAVDWKYV